MEFRKSAVTGSILETTLNTRDLGGYLSSITGECLRSWMILRSDIQNSPSEKDICLMKHHNILTIIDMRGEKDVHEKPSGFSGRGDFRYFSIPIEEGSGIPASTDAVSLSYMAIAQSNNLPRVFRMIAGAPGGVMVNCTAGKDRTGVVSAVLLGLCGVSQEDIVSDYMLSKQLNKERFDMIHANYPQIDMNIVIPNQRYMTEFLVLLMEQYGSFCGYLNAIGITEKELESIRKKLL